MNTWIFNILKPFEQGKSKPVKDVEDMMEEQLDHPDDAARDNSLDEVRPLVSLSAMTFFFPNYFVILWVIRSLIS